MCQKHGVGLITWAPMGMGVLAGRYKSTKSFPPESRAALRGEFYADRVNKKGIMIGEKFAIIAKELSLTPAQLAILWVKDQTGIVGPLIGPRTLDQLKPLLKVGNMNLTDETRQKCDELVLPGHFVTNFHNTADWMK